MKNTNKITLIFTFIMLLTSIQIFADEYIDNLMQEMMEDAHLPGLSISLMKNSETVYEEFYGFSNIEENIPITDSTIFMLASISKTFVGVALMQLWEQGYFHLDDPINDFLDFDVINPNYPDIPITFRQILTHASSIEGDFHPNGISMPAMTWGYDHPMTIGEYLPEFFVPGGDFFLDRNYNEYPPGQAFDYSSVTTTLIAYLVERISGLPFEDYCWLYIFTPLGMEDTSWFLSNIDVDRMTIHYMYENGVQNPYPGRGCVIYPCGWLKTTLPSLKKYMMALMEVEPYSNLILQSTTLDTMMTVQYPYMNTIIPNARWGLMIFELAVGGRDLWGHEGGSLGVTTLMYFDRESKNSAIMLSNGMHPTIMRSNIDDIFDWIEALPNEDENLCQLENPIKITSYPNPYSQSLTFSRNENININFTLKQSENIKFSIYNLRGQKIKSFQEKSYKSGTHTIYWNGEDSNGRSVKSGLYFGKLSTSSTTISHKIVIID